MPFQSEKQRRFLHANHPEIAKRWEKEYSHGGILDINESEEIISDDGNDIELTDYNAAFDDPNDLSTGVKTLFKAKDGGRIGLYQGGGPHAGGYGTTSSSSNTGGGGHVHPGIASQYSAPSTTTTSSTDDGGMGAKETYIETQRYPKRYKTVETRVPHTDEIVTTQIRDYYDPQGHQKRAPKNEKEKSTLDKIAFWTGLITFGAPILGIKVPGAIKVADTVLGYRSKIDTALKYAQKIGLLDDKYTVDELFENEVEKAKIRKAKLDEYNSLPAGHPEKIALEVELEIGMKDEWDGADDQPKPPQIQPITEEIQEYEDIAARALSPFDMKARQTLNAQLQNQWEQERLAKAAEYEAAGLLADNPIVLNKGGLANLFRVKNQ